MRNDLCDVCHDLIAENEAQAKDEHEAAGVAYVPQPTPEALYYMLDTHDVDAHEYQG